MSGVARFASEHFVQVFAVSVPLASVIISLTCLERDLTSVLYIFGESIIDASALGKSSTMSRSSV